MYIWKSFGLFARNGQTGSANQIRFLTYHGEAIRLAGTPNVRIVQTASRQPVRRQDWHVSASTTMPNDRAVIAPRYFEPSDAPTSRPEIPSQRRSLVWTQRVNAYTARKSKNASP